MAVERLFPRLRDHMPSLRITAPLVMSMTWQSSPASHWSTMLLSVTSSLAQFALQRHRRALQHLA